MSHAAMPCAAWCDGAALLPEAVSQLREQLDVARPARIESTEHLPSSSSRSREAPKAAVLAALSTPHLHEDITPPPPSPRAPGLPHVQK
jgi:hypothetical protein